MLVDDDDHNVKQGWTPLIAATFKSAPPEVVALLVKFGADKNHSIRGGKTVVDFALEKKDVLEQSSLLDSLNISQDDLPKAATNGGQHQAVEKTVPHEDSAEPVDPSAPVEELQDQQHSISREETAEQVQAQSNDTPSAGNDTQQDCTSSPTTNRPSSSTRQTTYEHIPTTVIHPSASVVSSRPSSVKSVQIPAAFLKGTSRPVSISSDKSSAPSASRTTTASTAKSVNSRNNQFRSHSSSEASSLSGTVVRSESSNATDHSETTTTAARDPISTRVFVAYNRTPTEASVERDRVAKLVAKLKERGVPNVHVDLSPYKVSLFISNELATATVFVPCLSAEYMHRVFVGSMEAATLDTCAQEFTDAVGRLQPSSIIPVVLEQTVLDKTKWKGPVGLMLHNGTSRPIVDLSEDQMMDSAADTIAEVIRRQ